MTTTRALRKRVDNLLAQVERDWQCDAFGIRSRRRPAEPERVLIRAAGKLWLVSRQGTTTELPPPPGIYNTLTVSVIEQQGSEGSLRVYSVAHDRPRRPVRARHHRAAPRRLAMSAREYDADKLLSVRAVAAQIGVNVSTVRKWLKAGAIQAVKVGPPEAARPRVRVEAADLGRLKSGV